MWSIIKDILAHAISIFVPKFRLKNQQYPSWFTPAIRHKLNCLHTLRKKAKKSPTTHNLNQLAITNKTLRIMLTEVKHLMKMILFTALLIIQITKSTNTSGIFLRVKVSPLQCFMMMLVLPVTKLGQIFSMNILLCIYLILVFIT